MQRTSRALECGLHALGGFRTAVPIREIEAEIRMNARGPWLNFKRLAKVVFRLA
jgi:hypothetical protein